MERNQTVVIFNRKSQLIETDSTVSCLLTPEEDQLFIPGIKYTMDFYV